MRNGIETKVAASTGASLAVTIAFAVIHWLDPQLAMPPAVIIGGLTTLVTLAAGYLAPHTHLRPDPAAVLTVPRQSGKAAVAGTSVKDVLESPLFADKPQDDLTLKQIAAAAGQLGWELRKVQTAPVPPSVQPSATGTSTTGGAS